MTPSLVRQHRPHPDTTARRASDAGARARDWAEIQERMFVPLYEAVFERLGVGPGTRLLGLGCGSGLALLLAAGRGATVTGVEAAAPERLALARERLVGEGGWGAAPATGVPRLVAGGPADAVGFADAVDAARAAYNLVVALQPIGCGAGDAKELAGMLQAAAASAERGAPVVLFDWGPPKQCATSSVLRVAARLADAVPGADGRRGSYEDALEAVPGASGRRAAYKDVLEEVAARAGLRAAGEGRVACPFGYADPVSAVRGLLSTGLFEAAVGASDRAQVVKELTEALHPYVRGDGTVWMANVFRYVVAHAK